MGGASSVGFTVYIDESGDEGFKFGPNQSSRWFVLSAVIVPTANDPCVALAAGIRERLNKPRLYTLHFKDLRHEHRIVVCDGIRTCANLVTTSILIYKPRLTNVATFKQKDCLYFYFTRYLLERVSWWCRDNAVDGDATADVIFEHRASITYQNLRDYLGRLRPDPNVTIAWEVIDPTRVRPLPKTQRAGLQVADAIAGSLTSACEVNGYGYTEDRYARMIEPVAYRRGGAALSYGVKFFPFDPAVGIAQGLPLAWATGEYGRR